MRVSADVAAVIVAAGNSVRMGYPKALLTIGKHTFVQNIGQAIFDAGIRNLYLTVPSVGAHAIETALSQTVSNFTPIENKFPHCGMLGSVQTVLLEKSFKEKALLFCPVDMPFLTSDLVKSFLELFDCRKDSHRIILATHNGTRAHPLLLSHHFFADVLKLGEVDSLRKILKAADEHIVEVEFDDPRILCNINTPEDYANFVNPSVNILEAAATDDPGVKSL